MRTFSKRLSYLLVAAIFILLSVSPFAHAVETGETGQSTASTSIIGNVSPPDGTLLTEGFALIQFVLGIPLVDTGDIIISVDGQPIDPIQINYMHGMVFTYVSDLKDGAHSLVIRVLGRDMNQLQEYNGSFNVQLSIWKESSMKAENIDAASLRLTWTPAAQSLGYRIYGNSLLIGSVDGNTTSLDATGLMPQTTYNFKVEAQRSDGSWTTDGPAASATTLPQDRESPIIEYVTPADGDLLTTAWPKITAHVNDKESGINPIMTGIAVNNRLVTSSYDESTGMLTAVAPRLPSGTHSLLVYARDMDGNVVRHTSSFTVDYEAGAPFLEWNGKLRAALEAGDPTDREDVRRLSAEIAELDHKEDLSLIDPIWNKIKLKLPASVDQAQLKKKLFDIMLAIGSLPGNEQGTGLVEILSDSEMLEALNTIAAAGGVTNLTAEDVLTFFFGDGNDYRGIEGQILYFASRLSPLEQLGLLHDKQKMMDVLVDAINNQLLQTTYYKISKMLWNLNVYTYDVQLTLQNFQRRLEHDVPAVQAMKIAYIRLKAQESVKVSNGGYQHNYRLQVDSLDVPPQSLLWKKVSGSPDIRVTPDGTVSIPEGTYNATAVIQAALVNPYGGNKVLFEKEVILMPEKDTAIILQSIMSAFENELDEVQSKFNDATTYAEQNQLIMDMMNTGKEAIKQIESLKISKTAITDATERIINILVQAASDLPPF
ncbi:fibronectin type III domain-containing protein [Paenibacillus sp. 2TAB23]|uniref:fibronectin type III domain-containing protein n=1 Tax=Paenibacillus sp. 2TAB23 TaxID=3233004 RepID=UPI003F959BB9